MPWIETEFEARADAGGGFSRTETVTAPIGGKLRQFRVETTSGCNQRTHIIIIDIFRIDDPSDSFRLGPFQMSDCSEYVDSINNPYRVRQGKQYQIQLTSAGFSPNETVSGKAAVEYSLFFAPEDSRAGTKMAQRLAPQDVNETLQRELNEAHERIDTLEKTVNLLKVLTMTKVAGREAAAMATLARGYRWTCQAPGHGSPRTQNGACKATYREAKDDLQAHADTYHGGSLAGAAIGGCDL